MSLNSHASKERVQASRQGDCPTSHVDKLEDKQQKFQKGETPNGNSGSVSNIKAELRERLKMKASNKSKAINNATESPNAAMRKDLGKAYMKAPVAESAISKEQKAEAAKQKNVSLATKADTKAPVAETAISKEQKTEVAGPNTKAPAGIGYTYFPLMETSEVPFDSSSEESSEEESDGTPGLNFSV